MTTPSSLRLALQDNLHHLQSQLRHTDLEALARQTRFQQRSSRKIAALKLVLGLVALAAETVLSLERVAAVIGLAANTAYSKQAFHQRLGLPLQSFLAHIAATLLSQIS